MSARHRGFEPLTYGSGGPRDARETSRKRPLGPASVKQVCKFPLLPQQQKRTGESRGTAWERVREGSSFDDDGAGGRKEQ